MKSDLRELDLELWISQDLEDQQRVSVRKDINFLKVKLTLTVT